SGVQRHIGTTCPGASYVKAAGLQQFVKPVPVRLGCDHKRAIAGLECLTNEATQGVQKKSVRLIKLHEVVRITHLRPVRARGLVRLGDVRHVQANQFLSRINGPGCAHWILPDVLRVSLNVDLTHTEIYATVTLLIVTSLYN